MAILIKDPEAERAVRELARRTGRTLTQTVRASAEQELARLDRPQRRGSQEDRSDHGPDTVLSGDEPSSQR